MKINENKFPFLKNVNKNLLVLQDEAMSEVNHNDILLKQTNDCLELFKGKSISIHYISKTIHDKLNKVENFSKAAKLLEKMPEMTSLILLPEPLFPIITDKEVNVKPSDLKMNAVLFSILKWSTYDLIKYGEDKTPKKEDYDEDDEESYLWELDQYVNTRWLHFIPINTNKLNFYGRDNHSSLPEEFATKYSEYNRSVYGNIVDYLWSFALFYNYTETDNKIVHGVDSQKTRRLKVNDEKILNETPNEIEIIDTTYFTKYIQTDEFGVTGHFRVQNFGVGNGESKIIFINDYKKTGYTREAKVALRKNSSS